MSKTYAIIGCNHNGCRSTTNGHAHFETVDKYGDNSDPNSRVDHNVDICDSNGLDALGKRGKRQFEILYSERCCGVGKLFRNAYENNQEAIKIIKKLVKLVSVNGVFIIRFCTNCDTDGYIVDGVIEHVLKQHTSFAQLDEDETLKYVNYLEEIDAWPDTEKVTETNNKLSSCDRDSINETIMATEEIKRTSLSSWEYVKKLGFKNRTIFTRDECERLMKKYKGIIPDFIKDCETPASIDKLMRENEIKPFAIEKWRAKSWRYTVKKEALGVANDKVELFEIIDKKKVLEKMYIATKDPDFDDFDDDSEYERIINLPGMLFVNLYRIMMPRFMVFRRIV